MRLAYVLATLAISSHALADTTFVSGTIVNQTWTPAGSPYCATGNLFIAGLTIQPGVRVVFMGNYVFEVGGVLTALGTLQDSISFGRGQAGIGWQGIFFNFSNPGSEMAYCKVTGSINSGIRIQNSSPLIRNTFVSENSGSQGGGINVIAATDVILNRCHVLYNLVSGGNQRGGGICVAAGNLTLSGCIVSGNSVIGGSGCKGGGVYVNGAFAMNSNCQVRDNFVSVSTSCSNCTIEGNAGGLYVEGTCSIQNSIIDGNTLSVSNGGNFNSFAIARGGGIYSSGLMTVTNSIISHNGIAASSQGSPPKEGAGIYSVTSGSSSTVTNSTIAFNLNEGLRSTVDTLRVRNCISYFNTPPVSQILEKVTATYSDIQGGFSGQGNIDFNPIFAGPDSLIVVSGSLCVDAGDPSAADNDLCFPPSLGTSRNDMGAHGGPGACQWIVTAVEQEHGQHPVTFHLAQNYPNPFNPETRIKYQIPSTTHVTLKLFDLLGREVVTLVNESLQPGTYEARLDGTSLTSGVYFYRLQAGDFVVSKKMLVLK